jgi:hypothetical protein
MTTKNTEQQHHPSCTENDKSLVQHCSQCGINEPVGDQVVCAICNERTDNLMRPGDAANLVLHNARLNKELPEMRKENLRLMAFLQDAAAFVRVANSGKGTWNSNMVLSTLIHDINGLANDEKCFSPRVTGYAQRERDDQ